LGGWLLTVGLPAWAKEGQPGVEPTLFVIGVAAAFAAGAAVGYAIGKTWSSQSDDGK
jgi:hypothetical protein